MKSRGKIGMSHNVWGVNLMSRSAKLVFFQPAVLDMSGIVYQSWYFAKAKLLLCDVLSEGNTVSTIEVTMEFSTSRFVNRKKKNLSTVVNKSKTAVRNGKGNFFAMLNKFFYSVYVILLITQSGNTSKR